MITCNKCGETKPLSEYEKQKDRPSHRKTCKLCRYKTRDKEKERLRQRESKKIKYRENPDEYRRKWERHVYGVCKEDFQYKECWICGSGKSLCIDHDHTTDKARGLLCSSCNFALGHFNDDINKLNRAVDYLKDGPHYQLPWREYP